MNEECGFRESQLIYNERLTESPRETETIISFLSRFRKSFAPRHGAMRRSISGNGDHRHANISLMSWCYRYLPLHFTRRPSRMHVWLMRFLDHMRTTRGMKINVLGPRGGAKSTIGSLAFPLREALEGREKYIWIVSDTIPQACAHLENIYSAVLRNRELMAAYPHIFSGLTKSMKYRSGVLEFRNGVRLEALSTGQKIRGRRHGENRPGLIICDDLQNDFHSRSKLQRSNSREWFFGSLMKAGTKRTNFIHLATALHRDALAMELHRTPGWRSRIFRAILRFPKNMELWSEWESVYSDTEVVTNKELARIFYLRHKAEMDEEAEVLWEDEEDLYTLMCLRAEGGHTAFEREKQNSPIDPEKCEWSEAYFDENSLWYFHEPKDAVLKVMALDPSKGKDANRGDYSAYVTLTVDREGSMYVDAELARCPVEQLVARGAELYAKFRPDAFGVEGNQFQDLLAGLFAKEFSDRGIPAPAPWLIHNHVAKEIRIRRLGQYLASKKIRFRGDSPGAKMLVEQLRQFPLGDHDDGPDALEMAIRLMNEKFHRETFHDGLGDRLPV